jgi:hypothetical protein
MPAFDRVRTGDVTRMPRMSDELRTAPRKLAA